MTTLKATHDSDSFHNPETSTEDIQIEKNLRYYLGLTCLWLSIAFAQTPYIVPFFDISAARMATFITIGIVAANVFGISAMFILGKKFYKAMLKLIWKKIRSAITFRRHK
ncbi:MAG: hypothetical protein JRH15_19055 [Deltaproteobacteria bacterium]|nr:hypothetical protein [Deltaproteobacteria bacterium]